MDVSPTILLNLYNTLQVKQNITALNGHILRNNVPKIIEERVALMLQNKARYQAVSHQFANPIRWYHIALLHELEAEQNFTKYLGNGQSLYRKTTIAPKGRGPFKTFEQGAIDAIKLTQLDEVEDWTVGNALMQLEKFNGFGYEEYHNMYSPYLWSGSQHYTVGKYVKDGKFDKNYVSDQIGIALLLKHLETIGEMKP